MLPHYNHKPIILPWCGEGDISPWCPGILHLLWLDDDRRGTMTTMTKTKRNKEGKGITKEKGGKLKKYRE
jgi:hypothetical protein